MTDVALLAAVLIVAYLATRLLTRVYIGYARRAGLLDHPNQRSSHHVATPRGGGAVFVGVWSIVAAALTLCGLIPFDLAWPLIVGALIVALVGYADDLWHLSPAVRAGFHLLAASVICVGASQPPALDLGITTVKLGSLGYPLAVLATAWSVNLFNFMDGTDGISGSEGLFVFGIGGVLLWDSGGEGLALVSWVLAACLCGFLTWNWPPAKVFMGDAGSGFLGLLVGGFAVLGEVRYGVPAICWAILYGVFAFDATLTILRRIARGEPWYEAHRSHAYQRLYHARSWSHRRIVVCAAGLNTLLSGLAIWAYVDRHALPLASGVALVVLCSAFFFVEKIAPMSRIKT